MVVARYAQRRAELKATVRSPRSTPQERASAASTLERVPRDAGPVWLRNRDTADGRPHGYFRKFGLSRVGLREMAHRGELPGVPKSSW